MHDEFSLPDDCDFTDDQDELDELKKWQQLLEDTRETRELIACALIGDVLAAIDAVKILQLRATPEVLDASRALCQSTLVADRQLGVRIIGRLGDTVPVLRVARRLRGSGDAEMCAYAEKLYARFRGNVREMRPYPKEAIAILMPMLETETDIETLREVIFALGEYQEFHPSITARIADLRTHPEPAVRFTVANRLVSDVRHPAAQQAIEELSRDEDEDVRRVARQWMEFVLRVRK